MTQPAGPARSTTPSLFASAARVFDLSLGQMLWSRRSVFLGVVLGGPVVLAVALRIVDRLHASGFQVNGAQVGGSAVFGMMIWLLYIRFIVPVLGVFYGTALIADASTLAVRAEVCDPRGAGCGVWGATSAPVMISPDTGTPPAGCRPAR